MTISYEDEKEKFLAHYGVRGMKWGEKKKARVIAREARGAVRLANSGGSAARANAKSIGKGLVADVLGGVGVRAVATLSKGNPTVIIGVSLLKIGATTAYWAKNINDIVDVQAAVNKDK